MSNDIAGNTTLGKRGLAHTAIGDMNLRSNVHNELEVRRDQILTAPTPDEASNHCLYAKGIVRGLEVGANITAGQAANLLEIFDSAYDQFEANL